MGGLWTNVGWWVVYEQMSDDGWFMNKCRMMGGLWTNVGWWVVYGIVLTTKNTRGELPRPWRSHYPGAACVAPSWPPSPWSWEGTAKSPILAENIGMFMGKWPVNEYKWSIWGKCVYRFHWHGGFSQKTYRKWILNLQSRSMEYEYMCVYIYIYMGNINSCQMNENWASLTWTVCYDMV